MAHIERRDDRKTLKYKARYRGGDGRVRSKSFRTQREAKAFLAEIETEKNRGRWVRPEDGRQLFGVFFADWLETAQVRRATADLYESLGRNHLLPTFGRVELARIGSADVRRWHARLSSGHLSPSTVAKCYRLLGRVLDVAVNDRLISQRPCNVRGASVERSPETVTPSVEQVTAIAATITPDYRAMVLLAAYGGLRFGECAGLRRRNVNVLRGTVAVVEQLSEVNGRCVPSAPKTDAGRRLVALPGFVVDALRAHLSEHDTAADGYVFTAPHGRPLRRSNFRRNVWVPACARAGIDGITFHALRHCAGTLAAQTGATTKEVMSRLGHSSAAAALRYQHASAERDREIAANLERFAPPAPPGRPVREAGSVVPLR